MSVLICNGVFTLKRFWSALLISVFAAVATHAAAAELCDQDLKKLSLKKGFSISILSSSLPGAREMAWGDEDTLFVGTREGNVYALTSVKSGKPISRTIAKDLNSPNGVAVKDGDLYVAEIDKIIVFKDVLKQLKSKESLKSEVVFDELPKDKWHGWKFIAFGPDGWLYIPIGAPCNVCRKDDERYATLNRLNVKTKEFQIYAKGIRNTVGFDWDPKTKELWFTDNGRDDLGDNSPPDELNYAPKSGFHFGFPYCHGKGIEDPKENKGESCLKYRKPEVELDPHSANLGMRFYTGNQFPKDYQNRIFIAQHGSWNRTTPIGYKVVTVEKKGQDTYRVEDFVSGWLTSDYHSWGRPVDVLVDSEGALLISDDMNGAIYKVIYSKK